MVGAEGFEPPTLCSQSKMGALLPTSAEVSKPHKITGFRSQAGARDFF
jgi:hypothetical protein